jgi:polyphosphate kinase
VLSLAAEPGVPLLERAKFAAIFSSNLDEFYQVRVAALKDQLAAGVQVPTPDGRTPGQTLAAIRARVECLVADQDKLLHGEIMPALREQGVAICGWDELDDHERRHLSAVFDERMFPVLTPLAVDPSHPFPYISNLALSLGAMVRDPETGERRFARVKVPSVFPRLVALPEGARFVPSEQVIAAHLGRLFVGMVVEDCAAFRVTRNADLTLEDEDADDLLALVEMELRRLRFGRAVRLEVQEDMPAEIETLLVRELDLEPEDVSRHRSLLDSTCLFELLALPRPDLKDEVWPQLIPGRIAAAQDADRSIFSVIRERALLVHHPYESFAASVEEFIAQAADDPRVQSIKMTLYRTTGDSAIAASLMRAAERGVQVVVLIELKARFDEANNLNWAKRLERAGVHVVYGLVGLKTHSKCVLVVRADEDGLRRYVHIGTGNYNAKTARIYEDIGLLTCDPEVGHDVTHLFNHLTGYSRDERYQRLIVAPRYLRHRLIDLIANEARHGSAGHIVLKMNSIADADIIEALYAASGQGCRIDLIVRGICCLRPGIAGMSDHITVRSILGRYLEHSRIYRFAHGSPDGSPLHLIGSADLMPRNLDRRIEVLVPVTHPKHQRWLDTTLAFLQSDDIVRFEFDGTDPNAATAWRRVGPDGFEPHAQQLMHDWVTSTQVRR